MWCSLGLAIALPITITSSQVLSQAFDAINPSVSNSFYGVDIPASEIVTATDGDSTAVTRLEWQNIGTETVALDFKFDQSRAGAYQSYAKSRESVMKFTADVDSTYTLSGEYNMLGDRQILFEVWLSHIVTENTKNYVFRSGQQSFDTNNENFILGGMGGDHTSILTGGLMGELVAGCIYELGIQAFIRSSHPSGDNAASASGYVNMTVTENPVPEPTTMLIIGTGLVTLIGIRRRQVRLWRQT